MSGIAGIVNASGAPVDPALIAGVLQSLAFRGPDASGVYHVAGVFLGHTLLRATEESEEERQPCSIDDGVWITADCRVDARRELITELAGCGRAVGMNTPDPELILHAYLVWGIRCLEHLIGDFAFAVWDTRLRRLFCARDHLGIKPFYYATTGGALVFGNTLVTLRLIPEVGRNLNPDVIGDFLLFGSNPDPAATCFAGINALPPASFLLWSPTMPAGQPQIEQYWSLPIEAPLRYRRASDYTDHFIELLGTAVDDRLRVKTAGLFMSGGLDSTMIAAIASGKLSHRNIHLESHTAVFDQLIYDDERHFAGLAARHLGLKARFHARDGENLYSLAESDHALYDPAAEPAASPALDSDIHSAISQYARVALYGEGPDNALHYEWQPYMKAEIGNGQIWHLFQEALALPFVFRQVPFSARFFSPRRNIGAGPGPASFPSWLNPAFASRLDLQSKFSAVPGNSLQQHPWHPVAYSSFGTPMWRQLFESHDPGVTRRAVEVRHPYLDIRMLRFLLAVPVVPWCRGKYLLRKAAARYLPAEITKRPKTPVSDFPQFVQWTKSGRPVTCPSSAVAEYVDIDRYCITGSSCANELGTNLRPLALDRFFHSLAHLV